MALSKVAPNVLAAVLLGRRIVAVETVTDEDRGGIEESVTLVLDDGNEVCIEAEFEMDMSYWFGPSERGRTP